MATRWAKYWNTLTAGIALNRCVISVAPCRIPRSPSFRSAKECPETSNNQEFEVSRQWLWSVLTSGIRSHVVCLRVNRSVRETWVDFQHTAQCHITEDKPLMQLSYASALSVLVQTPWKYILKSDRGYTSNYLIFSKQIYYFREVMNYWLGYNNYEVFLCVLFSNWHISTYIR